MVVEIKRTNKGQKKDIKCNEEWKKTSFVCEVGKFQDIQMCIRRSIWCCWIDPAEWSLGTLLEGTYFLSHERNQICDSRSFNSKLLRLNSSFADQL